MGFMSRVRGQAMEDQASGIDPEVFEADRLLREKRYAEAAESFAACLKKEPAHEEALRKLGYCKLKLKETREAREVWERLMQLRPRDHFAVLYTGLSHAMDRDVHQAVQIWKSYFNIKQPHIQREINLILALHEKGDELDPVELVDSVEQAIARQKQG